MRWIGGTILLFFLLSVQHKLSAQTLVFGNEWINSSQSYYKIPIAEDGIFQLTKSFLDQNGVPTSSIKKEQYQIWFRGEQIAINVTGQVLNPGQPLQSGEVIEFYGQKNRGALDSLVYRNPTDRMHRYLSLFTDTTAYFLTWSEFSTGKRMQQVNYNPAFDGVSGPDFHNEELIKVFSEQYEEGTFITNSNGDPMDAAWTKGEGWTGVRNAADFSMTLDGISGVVSGDATLDFVFTGRARGGHNWQIDIGNSFNSRILDNIQFGGYTNFNKSYSFTDLASLQSSGELNFSFTETVQGSAISLSLIKLLYPQSVEMNSNNKIFNFSQLGANNKLVVGSMNISDEMYEISDPQNPSLLSYKLIGNRGHAVLDKSIGKVFVVRTKLTPASMSKVAFDNYVSTDSLFVIITHKNLASSALEYAKYRASPSGRSFDTMLVFMGDLYNQFSYGEYHPIAIKQFLAFLSQNITGVPKHVLLIGKGLEIDYPGFAPYYRFSRQSFDFFDMVPTAGNPGSDILHVTELNNSGLLTPLIPIGRVSASRNEQVISYLQKVKEFEEQPFDSSSIWKKNIIHISGGNTLFELSILKSNLAFLERKAAGPFIGTSAIVKQKQTDARFELFNLSKEVNEGAMLIHVYGHSDINNVDVDIGYASDEVMGYNNGVNKRYPMLFVSGCRSGNAFTTSASQVFDNLTFGEDWVLSPGRGAIGFMAHSQLGGVSTLRLYHEYLYDLIFTEKLWVNRSIGEIQKEAHRRIEARFNPGTKTRLGAQLMQYVYQGDPAIKLFKYSKPDYALSPNNVSFESFDQFEITALSDSFNVKISASNLGLVPEDTVSISISRRANGIVKNYGPFAVPPILKTDTFSFTIRDPDIRMAGLNTFLVNIDSDSQLDELNETNNQVSVSFSISKNGVQPVIPQEFSIVGTQVNFTAINTDILSRNGVYKYEIDTSFFFNSPILLKGEVQSTNSIVEFSRNDLPLLDSQVYFWRVKEIIKNIATEWQTSSFTYIKNRSGWSQKAPFQFNKNNEKGIEWDSLLNKWQFVQSNARLDVTTSGRLVDNWSLLANIKLNDVFLMKNANCNFFGFDGVYTIILDRSSLEPKQVDARNFCRSFNRVERLTGRYLRLNTSAGRNELLNFFDKIPANDYVLIVSTGNAYADQWEPALKQRFVDIGASAAALDSLSTDSPYILFTQNNPNKAIDEKYFVENDQILVWCKSLTSNGDQGVITSTRIGPSVNWGTFNRTLSQFSLSDSLKLKINSEDLDGGSLKTIYQGGVVANGTDLKAFSPSVPGYINLEMEIRDTFDLTPTQLEKWIVFYESAPEGVVLIDEESQELIQKQKLNKGEKVNYNISFKNISNAAFLPGLVSKTIINGDEENARFDTLNSSLFPGTEFDIAIEVNSILFTGTNSVQVVFNPQIQPEIDYSNNDIFFEFEVLEDNIHPLLDVTFDGVRIIDGDIVAPNPIINILLKDENEFLPKSDTNGIDVFLRRCDDPNQCPFERVSLSSGEVTYALNDGNRFELEFRPQQLEDGIYTLRVQGQDQTGNLSGIKPYQIRFRVVNKTTISYFYPYPNPFSTKMQFVYSLTGEMPDELKIQIMTVGGRVVREITQDELGPLKIGHGRLTDFVWNGTDEYGDFLANGVYFYRVIARKNGQKVERFSTSADDRSFKEGIGKMYILR